MKLLKHKLTSLVLVSVLVISVFTLFFAASISYKQIQTLTESEKLVVHSYKIYAELEQLNLYAKDAESGQRGFLLTRDSTLLEPYYSSLKNINKTISDLKYLVSENKEQSSNLDSIIFLINQRFTLLGDVLNRIDLTSTNYDTVHGLIEQGTKIMTLAQIQMDRMIYNELQTLKMRQTEHDDDIKISPFSILFIVLFSLSVFILAFLKINNDLKGLAQTNNQLLINNEIFEHSEQIADISHWYWNMRENKVIYSNNLYRLLGCNVNEFQPTFRNFLNFVHPDDRNLLMESNKKTLRELSPTLTYFRINRKDGEVRYFKSIGKVISDNYGTNFSIGITADITEQYKKDKLIGEKIADLERSNKQLSAFNHVASHDLQEPLRKVQIFISRISGKDTDSVPEKIKENLAGIEKATIRMSKFIDDLLLYARANRTDKTFEPTDLNEILENSKRDLSQRIEEKNVIINCSSILPAISAIPFQMQQLFTNLMSNSMKYSKSGVPSVIDINATIIQGKDMPASIINGTEKNFYKISFTDNGIGFEQQYADNIFTLFYRLHNNEDYSGTGIGLAICKIIAENHKGYIHAEGFPGIGSTFSIFLPV